MHAIFYTSREALKESIFLCIWLIETRYALYGESQTHIGSERHHGSIGCYAIGKYHRDGAHFEAIGRRISICQQVGATIQLVDNLIVRIHCMSIDRQYSVTFL